MARKARQPIAKVGQLVSLNGYGKPMRVVKVALSSVAFSETSLKHLLKGWAYKCKPSTGKAQWYPEYEIDYVFTYMPISIDPDDHADYVQALPNYEALRDYLETLPDKVVRGCNPVRELKKLVEQCAKLAEGTSQGRVDAESEIISTMQ